MYTYTLKTAIAVNMTYDDTQTNTYILSHHVIIMYRVSGQGDRALRMPALSSYLQS